MMKMKIEIKKSCLDIQNLYDLFLEDQRFIGITKHSLLKKLKEAIALLEN